MDDKIKLYAKLNVIRLELSNLLSKSGKNDYAKFKYFQLDDFIPQVIELCNKNGLFTKFYIDKEKVVLPKKVEKVYIDNVETQEKEIENFEYREYGYLEITDLDTGYEETFKKETKEANVSGASAIQNLGAKSTYMKRYLYMDVFEISESDLVDGDTKQKSTAKATPSVAVKPVENKPKEIVKPDVVKPVESVVVSEIPVEKMETTTIETASDEPLSKASKQELVNLIKAKGKEPKSTLEAICNELGKSLTALLESDKNLIIEKING